MESNFLRFCLKRLLQLLRALGYGVIAFALVISGAGYLFLRGSLPQLDGIRPTIGVTGNVKVIRDRNGVPTITGTNRLDIAYAMGFLHSQERFFQMDLLRRSAAGELSALLGAGALPIDRDHRAHRFRVRAEEAFKLLPDFDQQLILRYSAGVNEGLVSLKARPFEYGLLWTKPQSWQPADTLLAVWAMYFDLQSDQRSRKIARGWIKNNATQQQLSFLLPQGSIYDASMDIESDSPKSAPIPDTPPSWFGTGIISDPPTSDKLVGSNNWAIAGNRSGNGSAIVGNDMHLNISLPNTWYRAAIRYPDSQGNIREIVGVTLPGTPLIIVGSNGHVAWGFTNSYGDYLDLIELENDKNHPFRIKTDVGWETISEQSEVLIVKDAPSTDLKTMSCSLGAIRLIGGKLYAEHWVADEPGAVNMNLLKMELANTVHEAIEVANQSGLPAQNMIAGDKTGHIGWTIAGALPARLAVFEGSFPYKVEANLIWRGLRKPADFPQIVDPDSGQLWTANSRQLGGEAYLTIGDGGADFGARTKQVRDDLTALGKTDEQHAYRIALDDRALFMAYWRNKALEALDEPSMKGTPGRLEFRRLLLNGWNGRASVDSIGYRLARTYMQAIYAQLFGGLDERLHAAYGEGITYRATNPRWQIVAMQLLDSKPAHWLQGAKTWSDLEIAAVDDSIKLLTQNGRKLSEARWGTVNSAAIEHPFVSIFPPLKYVLAAPEDELAGDEYMPRVAGPDFGQSERMTVSPSHEQDGIFNMPGGQSGHPLSQFFLAGHHDWAIGNPTPFLPGADRYKLLFVPLEVVGNSLVN
jgi:penicillin amidase